MDPYLDQHFSAKKQRGLRIKIYFWGLALCLLSAALAYVLIYSPIFKVDDFSIKDNKRLSNESVLAILRPLILKGRVSDFLGWHNFLVWPGGEINVSGTALYQATVKKDWLKRSVTIEVKERNRFGIWCLEGENCYWLDDSGIIFEEAPATEGSLIFKVYDPQKSELRLGFKVIEDRFLDNLLIILKNLNRLNVAIKKINFDRQLQEINMETYDGPRILLSIRFDPSANLNAFQNISADLDLKKVDYIDLRIENRVYYKN